MSCLTETELDSLFMDITPIATNAPILRQMLSTTPEFMALPAEIRNLVYENYFRSQLKSLKISARGDLVLPPLIHASKQIQVETSGYYFTSFLESAIKSPDIAIQAQIRDYNQVPLQNQLQRLSTQFSVPFCDLVKRVQVTFVGEMDFATIMAWINAHVDDPEGTPVFSQRVNETAAAAATAAEISGSGFVHAFAGSLSLVEAVRNFRRRRIAEPGKWRSEALKFLELVGTVGFEVGWYERSGPLEDIADLVFEVLAVWHHEMVKKRRAGKRCVLLGGGGGRTVNDDVMADVVYALWAGLL